MAKFSGVKTRPHPPVGPTKTLGVMRTHEGGTGFEKDARTALYTLGVTNMVSEPTFYESADSRDDRFRNLVAQVTQLDPEWMQAFIPWMRDVANMRTSPLVAALEYAHAGGPNARGVISSAMRRADEPAEALGYWLHHYGRNVPMAVKRGIGDAAVRLYNERSAIKYDGGSHGVRMGDVIELCHPNPRRALPSDAARDELLANKRFGASVSELRSALFKHLLDRRHGHWQASPDTMHNLTEVGLETLVRTYILDALPADDRRQALRDMGPEALQRAGFTWERLSGWLPGGMDAEAWEHIIPSMGYMALLRNLRNFEQAKVDEVVLKSVADRIADPDQVATSRQFPYRFYSAYINSGTMFFGHALEQALQASLLNIPTFTGRTLVLVDTSASMGQPVSPRSAVRMHDIAAVFGVAVAAKSPVDFAIYASGHERLALPTSVLRAAELVRNKVGAVGHGTETWPSVFAQYGGQDRIVVFTDCQDHPSGAQRTLPDVPIYVWDLNGYRSANVDLSTRNRYLLSGFSDTAFRLINLLEAGSNAGWPWET